jgi:UDP-2,3-diacylglucosamine pyrophosphatase LpxH
MKLIWLSDLHLEFVGAVTQRAFREEIVSEKPDAILITGDISHSRLIEYHLGLLANFLPYPIYFVLGNHDFYLGDFAQVDALVEATCNRYPNLIHLGHDEIVPLAANTMLIGHRGWADGRAGVGSRSTIRLNDHQYITDLREPDPSTLFTRLNQLGDESAEYISKIAPKALQKAQNLIIATHVPPFIESSLYQNKPSGSDYAPHFVNVALGRAILEITRTHPDNIITVLCGHTHHRAFYTPTSNLKVEVAGAQYHNPQIASILTIP